MNWMYILLLAILIIIAVSTIFYQSCETFDDAKVTSEFHPTVVGGITAAKIDFKSRYLHSTNVVKLKGNTDKIIVLVHNTPFDLEVWSLLYMYTQHQLKEGIDIPTLIAYDMLGHSAAWVPVPAEYNNADMKNYAWSYDEFTNDLYEIYHEFIKTGKITLVGYGSGGSVSQVFALQHPELIEELYILADTVTPPITGIPDEVPYLVHWLAKNPLVTYLTLEESFVKQNLCLWFENNNFRECPTMSNKNDTKNNFNTVAFLLAEKMFRTANCATYLQMDKLVDSEDLRPKWNATKVPFPVRFLVANRDNYINLDQMKSDIEIVKKSSDNVKMYIIDAKHGFPLMYPDYVYDLITGKDMQKNSLTIQVVD